MVYHHLPPGVAAAPLEGITIPSRYKSPTSDAPPPAYFPPVHSPSPQPPVYTSSNHSNNNNSSHWARFPSSIPSRTTSQKIASSPSQPSKSSIKHSSVSSRARPGFLAGKLKPAPKGHRHRNALQPDLLIGNNTPPYSSTPQSLPFSPSSMQSTPVSPCPPTHHSTARISLNVGVETSLDTEAEWRRQYTGGTKTQYYKLADENDFLIGERRRGYGSLSSYGNGQREGKNSIAAWCFFVALLVSIIVISAVVFRMTV